MVTLAHLLRPASRHSRHADRLEDFYRGQADGYDEFRERLLPGRRELVHMLPLRPGAVWVDLGGGTAHNLLHAGEALRALSAAYVVDLTPSLLAQARLRVQREAWRNVALIRGDATRVPLPDHSADIVTLSYALTMIPAWKAAVDEALRVLRPGGVFGAVDFYVSRPSAAPLVQHPWITQAVWPRWFRQRHVRLDPDHLPHLCQRFKPMTIVESRTRVPYLPLGAVPYYRFTGTRPRVTSPR